MLNATRRLVAEPGLRHPERDALMDVIAVLGTSEDAEALLSVLMAAPDDHYGLVDLLVRLGDLPMVERLHNAFVADGALKSGAPHDLLWAFGWAGMDQTRDMLFRYAVGPEWHESTSAVLGLLHLPLDGLEDHIRQTAAACFGKSLFHEYLPALVGRMGDEDLMHRLIADAREHASTDCFAGILLGAALLGPPGRAVFEDMVWDLSLESGLNQAQATAMGMDLLGMTIGDLTRWLRTRIAEAPETIEHRHFSTLREIALCYVSSPPAFSPLRFMPPRRERLIDVWRAVMGDDILGKDRLAEIADRMVGADASWMRDEFRALERRIEWQMHDEALLADLPPAGTP
ncbi:hypothetical protein [Brevundimonas sp.]|uniref:hypothetical protein n=1 Tax=Brevundimonas sp. TaxID=1871086 RepID=UPI001D2977A7|nr:hypothetical protein [Brevundimonas sp.]MBA4000818.1 hypothetical protein [Brevundimonas sp.]